MALSFPAGGGASGVATNASSVGALLDVEAATDALVALCALKENADAANRNVTNVDFGGTNFTARSEVEKSDSNPKVRAEAWTLLNPATDTLTATMTAAGVCDEVGAIFVEVADSIGIPTDDATATASGNSATPSISLTTVADNSVVVAGLLTGTGAPASVSVTTGTEANERDMGVTVLSAARRGPETPAGSYSLEWSTNADNFAIAAVSLAPAVAAGAVPLRTLMGVGL